MAIMTSAGVITQEIDNSPYVYNNSNSTAFYAGDFSKGPIDVPVLITSALQFKKIFGKPLTKQQTNDWYQVYNYLQYSSNIYILRSTPIWYNAVGEFNSNLNVLPEQINTYDDFIDNYNNISLVYGNSIKFIAQTPGTHGNDISVTCINKTIYDQNFELYNGYYPQSVYTGILQEDEYLVNIFYQGILKESFICTYNTTNYNYIETVLNRDSLYIYVKFNGTLDGYYDGNLGYYDGNLGYYDATANLPVEFNYYGSTIINLQSGLATTPIALDIFNSYMLMDNVNDFKIQNIIGNQLNNNAALELAERRRDSIAFIGISLAVDASTIGDIFPCPAIIATEDDFGIISETGESIIIVQDEPIIETCNEIINTEDDFIIISETGDLFITEESPVLNQAFYSLDDEFGFDLFTENNEIIELEKSTGITTCADEPCNDMVIGSIVDLVETGLKAYSEFVHITSNVKQQLNGFTGIPIWVNIAGDTCGLKARAELSNPWTPGAGLNNGLIKNVIKLLNSYTKEEKDIFNRGGINTASITSQGTILDGQRTFLNKESAFSRVNIRSLFNYLEDKSISLLNNFIFNENSYFNRGRIATELKEILIDVKSVGGIQSGKVEVHKGKENSIIIDIYIKPLYVAEFIQLRLINNGTKITSDYLVGSI